MANNYCECSFMVHMPSHAAARGFARLLKCLDAIDYWYADDQDKQIVERISKKIGTVDIECFSIEDAQVEYDPSTCSYAVWVHDTGMSDELMEVVQYAVRRWNLGPVAWSWAWTCDKPRVGEFGGGACFITKDEIKVSSTTEWIANQEKQYHETKQAEVPAHSKE